MQLYGETNRRESSLLRSELIGYIKIYIPLEISQEIMIRLGQRGLLQFVDLNQDVPAYSRAFSYEVKILDGLLRVIRYFEREFEFGDTVRYQFKKEFIEIAILEKEFKSLEKRCISLVENNLKLNKELDYLENIFSVYLYSEDLLSMEITPEPVSSITKPSYDKDNFTSVPLLGHDEVADSAYDFSSSLDLSTSMGSFVAGIIQFDKYMIMERVLWRILRGNLFIKSKNIGKIHKLDDLDYSVFVVFVNGPALIKKVSKLSTVLGATVVDLDKTRELRTRKREEIGDRIEDLKRVCASARSTVMELGEYVRSNIDSWKWSLQSWQTIYDNLNKFSYDQERNSLIGEAWIPEIYMGEVTDIINRDARELRCVINQIPPPSKNSWKVPNFPPTYHRNDKYTQGFQNIIDAYGVANYREVNPALFTIISFPFLFSMMFGDLGHGFIMFCAAAYFVMNESTFKHIKGEMFEMVYGGRYVILLMSIFSMFSGMIYNDIFSLTIPSILSSAWSYSAGGSTAIQNGVYLFGVDPVWHHAENGLLFLNSYKMKMSIIFGVVHMSLGICLNVYNYEEFDQPYSFLLEFVPQITFLLSIFGYLVLVIIYKWLCDWSTQTPPALLNILIGMFLQPGHVPDEDKLYSGQAFIQTVLLLIVVACVPVILLGKPLYLRSKHLEKKRLGYSTFQHEEGMEEMVQEEEFDFAEIMIHQSIHTIDFCLSCVSNTASYLRLWALSLAHAQLSAVLWNMVLVSVWNVEMGNPLFKLVALIFAVIIWFCLTCAILVGMEGLSAFLHALRLHWVEFNNKFYQGSGVMFTPYFLSEEL